MDTQFCEKNYFAKELRTLKFKTKKGKDSFKRKKISLT